MNDAKRFNHQEVLTYLKRYIRMHSADGQTRKDLLSDVESDQEELEDSFPVKKPTDSIKKQNGEFNLPEKVLESYYKHTRQK